MHQYNMKAYTRKAMDVYDLGANNYGIMVFVHDVFFFFLSFFLSSF